MATEEVVSKPEQSLRGLISTFVRKSTKQQRRKQIVDAEPCKVISSSSCRSCGHSSETGFWDNGSTTDSFLELSSEVSPVEIDTVGSGNAVLTTVEGDVGENGNLWKDELRRKSRQLTEKLERKLQSSSVQNGLNLRFPPDLLSRIAEKIVNTASSEPFGLRGCCINLRLLHEDIAELLMTSQNADSAFSNVRAEKCASWPVEPQESSRVTHVTDRPSLDFRNLPNLDSALTEVLSLDTSTDSGFVEPTDTRSRVHRRLQHSLSSSAIPVLPSLSSASRLQVACADLGRLDLCDSDSVPTFEAYVYLVPATSWSWWVRKFFSSSIKPGRGDAKQKSSIAKSSKPITLMPDFTIVKKKLHRTRSNSLEVIRCPLLK